MSTGKVRTTWLATGDTAEVVADKAKACYTETDGKCPKNPTSSYTKRNGYKPMDSEAQCLKEAKGILGWCYNGSGETGKVTNTWIASGKSNSVVGGHP